MDATAVWPIFPGAGFESSILTIILLGVLLRWVLTEWFGYTFAGLVVPGYLASVLIIAPWSGAVILLESVLTYGLVWLLIDFFGARKIWSTSFGRDRFFAFVLVSLFVRLSGELILWPQLWSALSGALDLPRKPPANLNSLGLVLVPLTANMFWKIGLFRGGVQVILPTLIVWWFSARVLIAHTNLRFSKFQVHYEAAAIDILATPKTYAIMLAGAAIAARTNLRYGWDFGGILIPALVAISFFEPSKVALSIAEAVLLASLVKLLLERSPLKRLSLEGPRRIVLVFGVAYIMKYAFAWWMAANAPHLQVTDFFSFGYLLSSLLALKIIEKGASRVLTPTIVVSVASFVIGGLGAELLFEASRPQESAIVQRARDAIAAPRADIDGALLSSAPLLSEVDPALARPLSVRRLDNIANYIYELRIQYLQDKKPVKQSNYTSFQVGPLGLEHTAIVEPSGRTSHLIAEPSSLYPQQVGIGMLWLRPGATGPALQIARGAHDPTFMLAISRYALLIDASHVVFGARSRHPYGAEIEPLGTIPSLFDIVHRELSSRGDIVRLRRRPAKTESVVWVGDDMTGDRPSFPTTLDALRDPDIIWDYPEEFIQDDIKGASMVLDLSTDDLLSLAASSPLPSAAPLPPQHLEALTEQLLFDDITTPESLRSFSRDRMTQGLAPQPNEIETLQRGVLEALLLSPYDARRRAIAETIAASLGLCLQDVRTPEGIRHVLLREPGPRYRGWGAALLRLDPASGGLGEDLFIETPRPYQEIASWRLSSLLAESMNARVLTFGSRAMPRAGVLSVDSTQTPGLSLAMQRAWLEASRRELTLSAPIVLQVRGLARHHEERFDQERSPNYILSHEHPFTLAASSDLAWYEALSQSLDAHGVEDVSRDMGQLAHTSLHGIPDLSAQLATQLNEGRFVRLWASARVREALTPDIAQRALFERLLSKIPPHRRLRHEGSLTSWLKDVSACSARLARANLTELDEATLTATALSSSSAIETRNPIEVEATLELLHERDALDAAYLLDQETSSLWLVFEASIGGAPSRVAIKGDAPGTRHLVLLDASPGGAQIASRTATALAAPMACEHFDEETP